MCNGYDSEAYAELVGEVNGTRDETRRMAEEKAAATIAKRRTIGPAEKRALEYLFDMLSGKK